MLLKKFLKPSSSLEKNPFCMEVSILLVIFFDNFLPIALDCLSTTASAFAILETKAFLVISLASLAPLDIFFTSFFSSKPIANNTGFLLINSVALILASAIFFQDIIQRITNAVTAAIITSNTLRITLPTVSAASLNPMNSATASPMAASVSKKFMITS